MTVVGVALLGKENNPLYIRPFASHIDPLHFHFIVHSALDHVEERVLAQKQALASVAGSSSKLDMYLGMLFPFAELRVFAYLTNSRIKLIAVLDDEEVKDSEMRAFFRRLHTLYADTISNPFYTQGTELSYCSGFQRQVGRIVEAGLY